LGIVTLLSPVTQLITSLVISPEYFPNAISYAVSSGALTAEAAAAYFNLQNYIIQGLIGAPILGIITTAIVAIFTRRKNNTLLQEMKSA
jgi:subtilase family serine protease